MTSEPRPSPTWEEHEALEKRVGFLEEALLDLAGVDVGKDADPIILGQRSFEAKIRDRREGMSSLTRRA